MSASGSGPPNEQLAEPIEPGSTARSTSLLARLSRHLRRQDWFAVVVELLVVVFGVFLGFQLNAWSDQARAHAGENRILEQLDQELAAAIQVNDDWIADYERHWNDLGNSVIAVQDETGVSTLTDAQCFAIWTAHIFNVSVPNLATLDEILTTGAIGDLRDAGLRRGVLEYDAFRAQAAKDYAFIRQDFANLIDVYPEAFPRRLIEKPTLENIREDVIPIATEVDCRLDLIRADPAIRNKLVSNLARTTAILQSGKNELAQLRGVRALLAGTVPGTRDLEAQPK